jgi:hypothetical protein
MFRFRNRPMLGRPRRLSSALVGRQPSGDAPFVSPLLAFDPLVSLWADPSGMFSDTSQTPCGEGDPIRTAPNNGSVGSSFDQATLGARYTLQKENGVWCMEGLAEGNPGHVFTLTGGLTYPAEGAVLVALFKNLTLPNISYSPFNSCRGNSDNEQLNFFGTGNISFGSTNRRAVAGTTWLDWHVVTYRSVAGSWLQRFDGVASTSSGTNTVNWFTSAFDLTSRSTDGNRIQSFGLFPADVDYEAIEDILLSQRAILNA